ATDAARWLSGLPQVTQLLSLATPLWEIGGPLLLFVPVHRAACRMAAVCGFLLFHLLLDRFVQVDLFAWVSSAAWLALLPGAFWDRLGVRDGARPGAPRPALPRS